MTWNVPAVLGAMYVTVGPLVLVGCWSVPPGHGPAGSVSTQVQSAPLFSEMSQL